MSRLEHFQAAFAAAVVHGPQSEPRPLAPDRRLQIYRNHYLISLEAVLEATFPAVCAIVGRGFFGRTARRFLVAHPPVSPCLHEYGGDFPDFLAALPGTQKLPYLADLARLEWAINVAYHAPDQAVLASHRLDGISPESYRDLVFEVHPALRVVTSRYPLTAIWRLTRPGCDPDLRVDLGAGGETLLVMREGDDIAFRRLDPAEHCFLDRLAGGAPVGCAVEAARQESSTFDLAAALGGLLEAGAFTDCRVPSDHNEGAVP